MSIILGLLDKPSYELECLAVLFDTERFRKYIEHQEFILETKPGSVLVIVTSP
jgi:hypothetical protein